MGKAYAARASKAANKKEAKVIMQEGFQGLETFYRKYATAVDGLKDMAKTLRRLPTVDPATPTVSFWTLSCLEQCTSTKAGTLGGLSSRRASQSCIAL